MQVQFNLYETDGTTLILTFPCVYDSNYDDETIKKFITHSNVRGSGEIIVEGGDEAWDLDIKGVVTADNYEDVIVKIDEIKSACVFNTPYVLKVNRGSSTYFSYHVKRLSKIVVPPETIRENYAEYSLKLRVGCY